MTKTNSKTTYAFSFDFKHITTLWAPEEILDEITDENYTDYLEYSITRLGSNVDTSDYGEATFTEDAHCVVECEEDPESYSVHKLLDSACNALSYAGYPPQTEDKLTIYVGEMTYSFTCVDGVFIPEEVWSVVADSYCEHFYANKTSAFYA